MRPILSYLLVLLLAEASASGGARSSPEAAGDSGASGPTISPIPPEKVETAAGGSAPAAPNEGWQSFPPTTPDVPAFSVPIIDVPPDPQPEYSGVAQVSGVLTSNPQILLVEIRVHAECGSGRDAAMRSSEAAAARIRSLLVSKGISEARMRMAPMGCTSPLRSPEVTAADRAANRRIEVVVLEVGDPAQK